MSYIIHKTDGTILTEIIDGAIDQLSTDLTLLGKNANSYGEYWNENFVHVLENFEKIMFFQASAEEGIKNLLNTFVASE